MSCVTFLMSLCTLFIISFEYIVTGNEVEALILENNLIKKYNVQLVPTVIMLNSDGTQSKRIEGAVAKEEYEECIRELK